MSKKSTHRDLQRLTESEIGRRPKLQFCLQLIQKNHRKEDETRETYLARLFLDNKDKLTVSADERDEDRKENPFKS